MIIFIFFCSLLNLIGVNSSITNFLIFLFNITMFLILGFKCGKITNKKGYLSGIIISLILCFMLIVIDIIFFHKIISFITIIYYTILLFTGTFGGMLGKSKKVNQ